MAKERFNILDGLIGFWPFSDTGTSTSRVSLASRYGALSSDGVNISSVAGKVGANATQFTGTISTGGRFSSAPSFSTLLSIGGSVGMTVGGWLNITGGTGTSQLICAKMTAGGQVEFQLGFGSGGISYEPLLSINIQTIIHTTSLPFGEWHFIVAGYDGLNIFISIDNGAIQFKSPNAFRKMKLVPEANITFGSQVLSGAEGFLNGAIDSCFLYARALSRREQVWWWNGGRGRTLDPSILNLNESVPAL